MDTEQVKNYFHKLYDSYQPFELVAIKDGDARRKTFEWSAEDLDDILAAIGLFEEKGYNVYASAMPLDVQKTGEYDRIWIDQDDVDGPWPWGTEESLQWPKPNTLVKTSEVDGGFRWQAIWKIQGHLEEAEARQTMKRMATQIGADQSVHDPRRILRVPGVMNAKRGVLARYMEGNEGLVSIDSFNLPQGGMIAKLFNSQVNNPNAILGEWLAGFGEGERNQKAYICARFLRSTGVQHDDALSIVALGGSRCDPAMEEHEIRNAVRSAYHGG